MSTPLCPLLLQARASIPFIKVCRGENSVTQVILGPASNTVGPLYTNPPQAPGVACIGSRCAWWDPEPGELSDDENGRPVHLPTTTGRCGQSRGRNFADPALAT